jgi:FkbM family methyltransferase
MKISFKVRLLNLFRRVWMMPPFEAFLARQTLGLPPNHFISKWVPNPYQYRPGSLRTIDRHGIKMEVDISDYIGHYLYFGFLDLSAEKLFSLCAETSIVIDVGANIGWTALRLARKAVKGKVYGFEPDPYNQERCQENVKRNTFDNLEVFSTALGNMESTVRMELRTPSNRGGNRIAPGGLGGSTLVPLIRMDQAAPVNSLEKIDLIKIDVEGYELQVLRGASGVLRKHKPILFVELDDNNLRDQGDSAGELVRFLEERGYSKIANAVNDEAVSSAMSFTHCHWDIIAQ